MSTFITDLWDSIFTPGPTPTILKATNVSFAALQIVLLSLLVATASVHFIVLSVLCAGLWWAINWFATELAMAQEVQKREAAERKERDFKIRLLGGEGAKTTDDSSDTEVETTGRKQVEDRGLRLRAGRDDEEATGPSRGSQSQSSVSTEDEWEKVSGGEKDKGK